jgi:serine/threonine-protein kinase
VKKHVVLKFGESHLGQEFPVTLSIATLEMLPHVEVSARLPSDPELYQLYATWATAYRHLSLQSECMTDEALELSLIDLETCRDAARLLNDRLNVWLQAESFRIIPATLMDALDPSDDMSMLIQTTNIWLKRLPWHLWALEQAFPTLDIGILSSSSSTAPIERPHSSVIRVLSVLSHANTAIRDEQLLLSRTNADVSLLVEPTVDQFYQAINRQPWDILFLSGQHPNQLVGETGRFYLNASDSLAIEELTPIIEVVGQGGLQVLMLNSWDGMAIAPEFERLGIPQIVTMREPAPTHVAYRFFTEFLTHFSSGHSFYRSIRQGRQALEALDAEVPCANWLPVVSHHPDVDAPNWQDWIQASSVETLPPLPNLLTSETVMPPKRSSQSSPIASEPTDVRAPNEGGSGYPSGEASESFSSPSGEAPDIPASRNLIHHRYQILRVLGRGGFGRTYLASDTHRFDERCVLKQFIPTSRSDASLRKARELFQREAKVLYQIDHPQIPKFLAWFTHEEDLFIVQEYVDGQSYLDLMRDRRFQSQKTFSEQEIIQFLWDLIPVLGYIHSIGIVHRDISPANIMFSNAKQKPMLIDFGVVKEVVNQILSGQYSTFARPAKATLVGKPGYSPPEQMQLGDCFPCSDFYSLGMTALVLLTGQDARVSQYQWRETGVASDGLARIIERMLAERPKERYQNAQAIMADLQHLIEQRRVTPTQEQGRSPIPPSSPIQPPSSPLPTVQTLNEPEAMPSSAEWEYLQTPTLSAQFIAECQQTLAEYIGPVASFAIEDILSQSSDLNAQEFVSLLAREIPDKAAAAAFQQQLDAQAHPLEAESPSSNQPPSTNPTPATNANKQSAGQPNVHGDYSAIRPEERYPQNSPPLSSAFIDQCRHELALCIGPMAQFIIDDALELASSSTQSQFIEAIAAEIPDPQMANTFRQKMQYRN